MRFWWLYGLLPVWAQRCSPWGSKPINIQATVPGGDAFAKALSVFTPWRRLTSPPTTSSLHPPASQQFLACSSPVFVEPSQWEVGGRNIPYSPVDLELALYLLWDRLWTRQTYSYFCWSPSCSAVLVCLSMWVCTLTSEVLQYMLRLSLPPNWQISHPFHSTLVFFFSHIWQ